MAIRSFRSTALRRFHLQGDARRLPPAFLPKITAVLNTLDIARGPQDVAGLDGLHRLRGDRANFWAVKVSRNWRIIFRFDELGHPRDIEFVDYH